MKAPRLLRPAVQALLVAVPLITPLVTAQSGDTTTCSDPRGVLFPQICDLDAEKLKRSPALGGQNFTLCCMKAFRAALAVLPNDTVVVQNTSQAAIGVVDINELNDAVSRGQFPCGAMYNGDSRGAPVVKVGYDFLAEQCPGWQLSNTDNLNAWLAPLSGFLVPAVVFCLSVPRRRKIGVPRYLFVTEFTHNVLFIPAVFLGAIAAGCFVIADTILWLGLCFGLAGPMIISGLYEALLDSRILGFLSQKISDKEMTLDMRCRCLMIILIGNLDLGLLPDKTPKEGGGFSGAARNFVSRIRSISPGSKKESDEEEADNLMELNFLSPNPADRRASDATIQRRSTRHLRASPWRHMERLLYGIRLYSVMPNQEESPRQWPCLIRRPRPIDANQDVDRARQRQQEEEEEVLEEPRSREPATDAEVARTCTRLRTMLQCQYSFGSIVGAPVIFFLGGLVFSLLQSLSSLGDNDTAESIAFGCWYMVIPHVAIVSGLLLAGNNPNILEGVFATDHDEKDLTARCCCVEWELVYPSCYRVAWQWRRGPNKMEWLEHLFRTYSRCAEGAMTIRPPLHPLELDPDMLELRRRTTLTVRAWAAIILGTLLLLGAPFLLAFLNAFFTPQVGVSCRSLTFLVYFLLEFVLVFLWLLEFACPQRLAPAASWRVMHGIAWLACCAGAVFVSLGGTLMQIMGVYSADQCYVDVLDWSRPWDQRPMSVLSNNSHEMIMAAIHWWVPCAAAAIAFMAIVSYAAWFYQRRMRDLFGRLVRKIDAQDNDREDAGKARNRAPLIEANTHLSIP